MGSRAPRRRVPGRVRDELAPGTVRLTRPGATLPLKKKEVDRTNDRPLIPETCEAVGQDPASADYPTTIDMRARAASIAAADTRARAVEYASKFGLSVLPLIADGKRPPRATHSSARAMIRCGRENVLRCAWWSGRLQHRDHDRRQACCDRRRRQRRWCCGQLQCDGRQTRRGYPSHGYGVHAGRRGAFRCFVFQRAPTSQTA